MSAPAAIAETAQIPQTAPSFPTGERQLYHLENEQSRLEALYRLNLLDTAPEPEFDDLVQLAAAICDTPISVISLIDDHRQWFKASVGLDATEVPRSLAFCNHTIQQAELLLVEDATLDERFREHPMVAGDDGLRFYAGLPLAAPAGQPVGTLCVADRKPRCLTPNQKKALRTLASQVNARIELRTKHRALEDALRQAQAAKAKAEAIERRFQTFMDSGPFLAYIKDADGRMLYYNEACVRHFRVSREAMLNKTDSELWPADLAASYRQHDLEVLRTGTLNVSHEETSNPDGSVSVWRSYKFPCTDADGQPLLGGVSVEVTEQLHREAELQRYQAELEAANRRLSGLAHLDPLTGLHNRRVFDERVGPEFQYAREAGEPLSILMLDVDHFKNHNDRFGHAHGDQVLQQLAARLQEDLRAGDLIARYGGEEFIILLTGSGEGEARAVANRLLDTVRDTFWQRAPVTVSMGLSTLRPATRDAEQLIRHADEALYAAKCAGRDRVVSYPEAIHRVDHAACVS